jgi:hypothetical protein
MRLAIHRAVLARTARVLGFAIGLAAVAALAWSHWCLVRRLDALEPKLESIYGEITRIRIEGPSSKKGPEALLEKLRTYASLAVDSRRPQPDYEMAKKEMDSVMRAFASIGKDAYGPIVARFRTLDSTRDFEEMNWLLQAACEADPQNGKNLVVSVLQGGSEVKPTPRLRIAAANQLLRIDTPLAQVKLRQIVLYESYRGRDPARAAAVELPPLDPQSIAASGFHFFMLHYLRSGDPDSEDTVLQILGRDDNDTATTQEMIKWLGEKRCAAADARIEELYRHPPPGSGDNAIYLNICLDALARIRGAAGRPFFERELAKVTNPIVARNLQFLIQNPGGLPQLPPPPTEPQKKK